MKSPIGTIALISALGSLAGCATGQFGPQLPEMKELPKDVPAEMQAKFEIKDVQAVSSPKVEPAVGKPIKKKRKIRKTAPASTSQETVFTYPNRRPKIEPIWVGELQSYDITYFGVPAGVFTLEALPFKAMNNRKVYDIKGTAMTSKLFELFYRLNDSVESFIDYEGIFSHRFHLLLDETKQERDSLELHDSEKGQTFFWNRWNHKVNGYKETKEYAPIQPFSQDSLSALYFLRTNALAQDQVITFPVISEGKSWEAICTVIRKETLDTPIGRIQTVVVKPETKYQGILQKKGDSYLWFSDDDRHLLIRLEAKVKIGTVVATLKSSKPGTPPSSE